MIVSTDAIILRVFRYSDSSKIVRMYTRDRGKLSALAKGAMRGKLRFGATLDPMSYVHVVLYLKEARELQTLTQCDFVKPFRALTDDVEKMAAGMAVVELLDGVTHSQEQNEGLFALAVRTLETLNSATKGGGLALYFYEMRLLEIVGFKPNVHSCEHCGTALTEELIAQPGGELRLTHSGVVCGRCSSLHKGLLPVSPPALRVLQRLQEVSDPEMVTRFVLTTIVRGEVASALRRFLMLHVEGLRALKSEAVFASFSETH